MSTSALSRRDWLLRSAGSGAAFAAGIGAPALLFPRKAGAQSPDLGIVSSVLSTALSVNQSIASTGVVPWGTVSQLVSVLTSLFNDFDQIGVTETLGECIGAAASNRPDLTYFNSNNASAAYNAAGSVGLPRDPSLFLMDGRGYPGAAAIQAIRGAAAFKNLQQQHLAGLQRLIGALAMNERQGPYLRVQNTCGPGSGEVADQNIELAAAGVMAGGGAGLVGAAAATDAVLGGSLAAEITGVALLSGGVGLIAGAVVIVGVWGYSFYQNHASAKDCVPKKTAPTRS